MPTKTNNEPVDWEYCECGCKGYILVLANLNYWATQDHNGNVHLVEGHGFSFGRRLGVYKSPKAVDEAVKRNAKPKIEELAAEIKKAMEFLEG